MEMKRVLLIGVDPKLIDFSNVPGVDAEKIKSAGRDSDTKLRELGFEPRSCLIDLGETAESAVRQALTEGPFVCVMIGAGLRVLPEHTVLFEKVINIIHSDAPAARLCFNTHPGNTPEAVQRVA